MARDDSALGHGPLSRTEVCTLQRLCDTVLPDDDSSWCASATERVVALLRRLPDPDTVVRLRVLLRLLDQRAGTMLLTGCPTTFSRQSREERERSLGRLVSHPFNPVRAGASAFLRLAALAYYAETDETGRNPLWPALGYPGPIAPTPSIPRALQPARIDRACQLTCDVAVVGSGVGGGMVAAELARAGHDVIVLEAGDYLDERDFTQTELEMLRRLYLDGGLSTSQDGSIRILAGACLGGGSVVNYTTSLPPPESVRTEWDRLTASDLFTSERFSRSLAAAQQWLGVNTGHNRPSRRDVILERGLAALGWHVAAMPRDVQGCTQDEVCGYCGYGCVRGAKRSSVKTTLRSAAEAGARLVVRCHMDRILVEGGQAVGVEGATWEGHRLSVRARVVVVAAGAIGSAALLLRSGVRGVVGTHLFLHPVTPIFGVFEEEVCPWTGTLQARYSAQFADLDGGYGVRFETAPLHPALLALATPWQDAQQLERTMTQLRRTSVVGILLRDRDGGRVTLNRWGDPVIRYRLSRYDQRHICAGVAAAAQVLVAAGAREVFSTHNGVSSLVPSAEPFDRWRQRVERVGYGSNRLLYASFHQTGTCRMGGDPERSVVGLDGQTHHLRRLYVADGSVFPSAVGVNPMLTIAAVAHLIAQDIKAGM